MLRWALIFLIVAIIASLFSFGWIASMSFAIAKILFFVFLALFVISIIVGGVRRSSAGHMP